MARDRHALDPLGVSKDAEDVYLALLTQPGSTSAELRGSTDAGRERLRRALAELEQRAMITRQPGTPARFQPSPPDVAVEVLIGVREEELNQARLQARQWMALRQSPPDQLRVHELVEILTSREAYDQRWRQLQQTTQQTLEVFVRPPFVQSLTEQQLEEHEAVQAALLERGVVSRGVYDAAAVSTPGLRAHQARMARLGEAARVVSHLPLKLVLSDRRTALVPVLRSDANSAYESALVVHKSALLDALIALFDVCWQRGTDIALNGSDAAPDAATANPTANEDTILTLLAAGLKDQAIAHELRVSSHTVRRRIAATLKKLDVTTRFQAGLALGRQGWPAPNKRPNNR